MRTADSVYETLMGTANKLYAEAKFKKAFGSRMRPDLSCIPPEELPRIESDQVKSLARAVAVMLDDLAGHIEDEYVAVDDLEIEPEHEPVEAPKEPEVSHGYICFACARKLGAKWPDGHAATCPFNGCPSCKKVENLASIDDWNWPKGSKKPGRGAGRD